MVFFLLPWFMFREDYLGLSYILCKIERSSSVYCVELLRDQRPVQTANSITFYVPTKSLLTLYTTRSAQGIRYTVGASFGWSE